MADVLRVSALKLGDPLQVEVLPKADDTSLAHAASLILDLAPFRKFEESLC